MRRRIIRLILTFALSILLAPPPSQAQYAKVYRIGVLAGSSPSALATYLEAFRQGLRELGYVEGQTILIEYRYADGRSDRLPELASDLVRLGVAIIVTEGGAATQAARNATATIPIVHALVPDPVGMGFARSLARPGGNITGPASLSFELIGKHMELLKEVVPGLTRLAVLWIPRNPFHERALKGIDSGARALGIRLQLVEAGTAGDLDTAFAAIIREGAAAFTIVSHPMFDGEQRRIAEFAVKNRLPAVYTKKPFAEAGGLMAYGTSFPDLFRRSATYVDKILKGAKPADLPVEQATKFELVINLKTAKALGLTIPHSILIRADKVIE